VLISVLTTLVLVCFEEIGQVRNIDSGYNQFISSNVVSKNRYCYCKYTTNVLKDFKTKECLQCIMVV